MTSGYGIKSFRFGKNRATEDRRSGRRGEMITAGVPLAKLIKRRIVDTPELVLVSRSRSVAAEQFRRLKTLLVNEHKESLQVILVTSAAPGEGKSIVSTNLALAFAADHQGEVLLIDADLRRPTVEHWIEPRPRLGVAELLLGQTELDHAILELENTTLRILPAGAPPEDPSELLSAEPARRLFAELRTRFTRIIVDTPPIVPFTDADAVGALCDGALVVVRAGKTRQSMYLQAVNAVTSTRVLGSVLNDVTYSLADREYYQYEKSYHAYYDRERSR